MTFKQKLKAHIGELIKFENENLTYDGKVALLKEVPDLQPAPGAEVRVVLYIDGCVEEAFLLPGDIKFL